MMDQAHAVPKLLQDELAATAATRVQVKHVLMGSAK